MMPQTSFRTPTRILGVVALVMAMLAGACGSTGDDLAETLATAQPSSDDTLTTLPGVDGDSDDSDPGPTSTGPTITGSTTTLPATTAPPTSAPNTDANSGPVTPDAVALAAALEVGATQLEATVAANTSRNPLESMTIASRAGAEAYRAIPATEGTAELLEELASGADDLVDLLVRYEPLLTDPTTAEGATTDFLIENQRIAEESVATEQRLLVMVNNQLSQRGEASGEYLIAVSDIQMQSGALVTDILAAMQLIATDPVGALRAMQAPVESIGALGPQVEALTVPPSLADYHQRYVSFVARYAETFGAILDAIDEGGQPTTSELLGIQSLGVEGPELNAERTRLTAASLRGELG